MKYCPNCNIERDGGFCPDCGTPLIEKPEANDIPGINLGDGNAISGGLNVNASKSIHNEDRSVHNIQNTTSTVNNIQNVAAQKTEMELLQERKTLYLNACKRAYEDNLSFNSLAALLVKVIAMMLQGSAGSSAHK